MIIRSKAPLRIGLAGGGTDVSPYSDMYGGAILNATVNLYAHACIEPLDKNEIILFAADKSVELRFDTAKELPLNGELDLLKGVYNFLVSKYQLLALSFKLTTSVDAPQGSGLGTSSTLTVAILGAFAEWLNLPLGEYDIAKMAFYIERVYLNMAGGKQDQYAATFGGVNFMEFFADDKVIVNPLRIHQNYLSELEHNLLLFYTESARFSSEIIEAQSKNVSAKKEKPIQAMHMLKQQAIEMKEALLTGKVDEIGRILDFGWQQKKQMAEGITNSHIDLFYQTALDNGAGGGKISGAGGGGFMIFYCPQNAKYKVKNALLKLGGRFENYSFVNEGLRTWKI
jgi:D-glycero-alpha-D-manno-heptose-7-phosphate kinase